jgi:hypothetical protein
MGRTDMAYGQVLTASAIGVREGGRYPGVGEGLGVAVGRRGEGGRLPSVLTPSIYTDSVILQWETAACLPNPVFT